MSVSMGPYHELVSGLERRAEGAGGGGGRAVPAGQHRQQLHDDRAMLQ